MNIFAAFIIFAAVFAFTAAFCYMIGESWDDED